MSLDIPDEARKAARDEELAQTRFERSYWRDLVASNLSGLLRGMSRRASFFRRQYIEAARLFEVLQRENADLRAKLAEQQKRVPSVLAAELDRLAAELRENATPIDEYARGYISGVNRTVQQLSARARELRGGTQ